MTLVATRNADTTAPLLTALVERWSPRAYDPTATVSDETVHTLLEAARWAPSASNTQPWRFIVAHRGTEEFTAVHAALMGFNQAWANSATMLIVNVAKTQDDDGKAYPWAEYDVGQAVAHMTIQAQAEGLHTHQMGGFDAAAIAESFTLGEEYRILSVTAVGVLGDADSLPDVLREREVAPRQRLNATDLLLK